MSEENAEAAKPEAQPSETQQTAAKDSAPKERQVKARVLTQCTYGQADDVVLLSKSEAKQATADGIVDTDPAAVAYAEGLKAAD
jgi:hypothetical protein